MLLKCFLENINTQGVKGWESQCYRGRGGVGRERERERLPEKGVTDRQTDIHRQTVLWE